MIVFILHMGRTNSDVSRRGLIAGNGIKIPTGSILKLQGP
jgi:hypothetical protein